MILVGSYSRARPHDPETYADAIAATLAGYPREVIQRVTDPRTGLQRKLKWLPEVADVVEACDAEVSRLEIAARVAALPAPRPKAIEAPRDPEKDAEMARRFQGLMAELMSKMKA